LIALRKIFLQARYDCNRQDNENLEKLQEQIQDRINFLNENNMNSYNDPKLLEYYEIYSQIQRCLFEDHTDQYLLIGGILAAILFLVFFRWKMIKKVESANKRLNFKG